MDRRQDARGERLTIFWNGRPIEARKGESAAAALHRAGIRGIGCSRKRHRPLGHDLVLGLQAQLDGIPNIRLDRLAVRAGLALRAQNLWPSPGFDLLRLARLIPGRWLRGGFEHPRALPSGSRRFEIWERILRFLAGGGDAVSPSRPGALRPGERIAVDVAVVGGGPAGRRAAIAAAEEGRSVLLISRDRQPGRFAAAMGEALPSIPASVRLLAGWEAVALYRRGRLLLAAPHDGGPASVIDAAEVVLATGRRSLAPLVPGADLPGVMDLPTVVGLLQDRAIPPGQRAFLIGTSALDAIAARLRGLGLALAGTADSGRVVRILGWDSVRGVELAGGKRIVCESVIHAGPWRPDPFLPFQAGAEGELRLEGSALPAQIRLAGAAALPAEPVACARLDDRAFVCPCMDVMVAEIRDLVTDGETHVEVLKRLTGCGMGPCQGMPCWDYLGAALEHLTGQAAASFGHPSYRAPRGGLTLAQAGGLADLVEPEPHS
ncbi:MAG TPA: FAD-dependent oxidoreductase [Verrucomicrobiae bacterium]|nr:FAD-dependent oxidoreductase [Verrucomicrobiae bacterium]